ncbi:MAG: nucleoside hydrolase, partial [Clostridia bacterium]|nr:nucleoside hydrolase [Clostridia bacterium]
MERIIFDTDIGTDIDDSFALAYLLARRDCEIEGVTTVSGEAEKRAELVSAILYNAGREDIPV